MEADMLDPNAPFFQARLKHIWANQHISQLQARWEAFLKTDFCRLVVEDNADSGSQMLRIVSVDPLPAEMVLTLGDAVHNLRCSLDYVVNELLGWKDTRLTFPMGEEREELVDSFRTQPETVGGKTKGKGRNAAIEMAVNGIGTFIVDEIRPYKSDDGFLWPLGKLDGRDKHRLLIPVLVPQTIRGINVVDKNDNRMINCIARVSAGGVGNIAQFGAGGLKIESYGKPTAEIFLNEPGVVESERMFPTLVQMSQAVAQTIGRIEEFALSSGWVRPS